MHFFLAAMGSAGDVYPFIAMGEELRARGHAVDLQASPWFARRIEAAGLGFVAAGSAGDYERLVQRSALWHPRHGFALLIDELLAHLGEVHAAALGHLRHDTVLVGSTLAWHMRLLQEQRALPTATVHLAPSCIVSADAPPILPVVGDLGWMPRGALRTLQRLTECWLLDPPIRRGLDPLRADLGLGPARRVMSRWIHSPDLVVAAWPDWFGPRQPDWPAASVTTGFPTGRPLPGPAALDPSLERFLQAGPPPIGITPGSAMAHGRAFFARAVAACDSLGERALLISPYAEQLPAGLAHDRVHHVAEAPFERLVPRLAALVHHGGIGTCARALVAGVPQLVCPFAYDQFDNAARIERLGAGRHVALEAPPQRWAAALRTVRNDAGIALRCRDLGDRIAAAPRAVVEIVDRLEALGSGAP